mmetsp:Transcript_18682/g.46668  ORF Transcript_18682/g.46668 Transcript_18682/m.46668 type:complete len:300 (-) Transcript_18682:2119-3018(-)
MSAAPPAASSPSPAPSPPSQRQRSMSQNSSASPFCFTAAKQISRLFVISTGRNCSASPFWLTAAVANATSCLRSHGANFMHLPFFFTASMITSASRQLARDVRRSRSSTQLRGWRTASSSEAATPGTRRISSSTKSLLASASDPARSTAEALSIAAAARTNAGSRRNFHGIRLRTGGLFHTDHRSSWPWCPRGLGATFFRCCTSVSWIRSSINFRKKSGSRCTAAGSFPSVGCKCSARNVSDKAANSFASARAAGCSRSTRSGSVNFPRSIKICKRSGSRRSWWGKTNRQKSLIVPSSV